jgi:hypothetical protein
MEWFVDDNRRFVRDWCKAQAGAVEEVCIHRSTERVPSIGIVCHCCKKRLIVWSDYEE